ncbi:MAG: DUF2927 domain-containing protein [Alphaproteobacteria bacterium]|nr:MAG: DUF2927 domain-containing protein [Alphaproteobacteria bacterium]
MKSFASSRILPPSRDNGALAGDFLDLTFALETGRALPVFTRFEGPMTVAVAGPAPASLSADLERLLKRLRIEAGLDIRRDDTAAPASVTVSVVPKAALKAAVPHAACFVAPNVSSWAEFLKARNTPQADWTRLTERRRMAVFIPTGVSAQEMRDCLHEEIAQALGPVNDLYRLPDSVFNDDNFQAVLTGFDMLMLRVTYDPALHSGMSRAEVSARLPAILARVNPAGGHHAPRLAAPTPKAWKSAIEAALGGAGARAARQAAARRAVDLARANGWHDTRLAFSLYALGRLYIADNTDIALAAFREAEAIYASRPETRLQAAHMGVQLAAYALAQGRAETAIRIVDSHLDTVTQGQNAALLATLMMIKAEALALEGRAREAEAVRLDSLGWARYGFGTEARVAARMAEIAALAGTRAQS